MLRFGFVVLVGALSAGPALAGPWTDGLFEEFGKDFGSVPHGQVLTHPFALRNNTGRVVTISNIRVSCGLCTSATALQGQLRPGEETSLVVRMDSGKFNGPKTVYIYIQFSEPQLDEVRLWIQANSRSDVNVAPETLAFGHHKRGAAPSLVTTLTFFGEVPFEITDVQSESNYVQAKVVSARHTDNEVSYDLTVKLRADTPVGKWFTDVWVRTNNPAMPRVRVPLTVEIEPPVTVSFTTVSLGDVHVGQSIERKLVVRGARPFRITEVEGTDDVIQVKDNSSESKELHVLTVRLKGDTPGDVNRTLKVITDIKDEGELQFRARGHVVP
jgi:hypothetical protein